MGSDFQIWFTGVVCGSLRLAVSVTGLAEVGPDHAGVGPSCCTLGKLVQELDATLDEKCAGLLQPHIPAAVAYVTLRAQQEIQHMSLCRKRSFTFKTFKVLKQTLFFNYSSLFSV